MKVCKKCKKHVANKLKICKYCGSDVSKARIIKEDNKNKKTTNLQEQNKIKKAKEESLLKDNNKTKIIETNQNSKKENAKTTKKYTSKNKQIEKVTDEEKNITEVTITYKHDKRKIKRIVTLITILIVIISTGILYNKIYTIINNTYNTINPNDNNQNRVFNINEKITYKNVNYTVTKVETSQGTKHKHPKEGNEYIIVTIEYENKSNEKVRYSYKDWKMSNSLGEEKPRIFAPVNASNALYTGNLVIGGTKTGSMVFEQPLGDEELQLHFYEYIEPEEDLNQNPPSESEEEQQKPIFTIKIPKMSKAK